jgi:hypothetical protein
MTDGWLKICSTAVRKGHWIVAKITVMDVTRYEVTHDHHPGETLARCGSFMQAKAFIRDYDAAQMPMEASARA